MNKTIVYVDDDADDRDMLRFALEPLANHTILTFSCGSELFAYLAETSCSICLIVLDINMPGQSGLQIAGLLKQNASFDTIPIVMLTTGARSPEALRLADSGVPVIEKGSSLEEIAAIAKRLERYC